VAAVPNHPTGLEVKPRPGGPRRLIIFEKEIAMATEQNVTATHTKFTAGGKEVKGFLARPVGLAKAPAVIVIHEWWGLNDHLKNVAERYAHAGFVAAAPDLYDGRVTADPQEATRLMGQLKEEKALDYLKTVVEHLRGDQEITSLGVTGFCMGGTFALLLPCHTKLEAAVPFYGDVPADTSIISRLSCPVLFIGGEKDEWITVEKMKRLEAALQQHGKEGEVKIYKDAPHAFFNNTRPEVYRQADAQDAWQRAIDFFSRHLGKGQAATA
jgi:carboxymethylenebutenolidase